EETLRAKCSGTPEMVIAYLSAVAAEVREILAQLGARSIQEIVGRVDLLRPKPTDHPEAARVNLEFILRDPDPQGARSRRNVTPRNDRTEDADLDAQIIREITAARAQGRPVRLRSPIRNAHRAVGARVAGMIAEAHGDAGLPDGSVTLEFAGAAGQSLGAFCVPGITLMLEGEANDYVGKGMAGGVIVIRPPRALLGVTDRNVILGRTVLYGATGGRLFAAGRAGERFAVRNSGASAVVEGVGDHGCEYMTAGAVVVLGEVGRNFAAGMTGGVAYALDLNENFKRHCNHELVTIEPVGISDEQELRRLIQRHLELTGSLRARDVLW